LQQHHGLARARGEAPHDRLGELGQAARGVGGVREDAHAPAEPVGAALVLLEQAELAQQRHVAVRSRQRQARGLRELAHARRGTALREGEQHLEHLPGGLRLPATVAFG
jgi:hypothetical protein